MPLVIWWLFVVFFVGCLAIVWWTLYVDHNLTEEHDEQEDDKNEALLAGMDGFTKKKPKKAKGTSRGARKPSSMPKPHDSSWDGPPSALLVREIKGHTAQVTGLAFSNDGRFVATSSEDGTVRVTFLSTVTEPAPRYFRLGIERDHVTALSFSDNSKRLVCATAKSREMMFYSIPTEKETSSGVKPEVVKRFASGHNEPVTHIRLLDVDKWMVVATCSCGSTETGIRFMNPKGECLATLDTNQISNYTMIASPDNRFLAVGAGMPEVKILEVSRSREGDFSQLTKAMTLSGGHSKGVHGVAFNHASTRVITASVDGSWALWDTTVRYNLDEDPRKLEQHTSKDMLNSRYSGCALGGKKGMVAALSSGRHLFFHAVGEGAGKQLESVGAAHGSSGAAILSMEASKDGKLLVTRADGDSRARLWSFPDSE